MPEQTLQLYRITTELGTFGVSFSDKGLARVILPGQRRLKVPELTGQQGAAGRSVSRALKAYALGKSEPAALAVALDLSIGTTFQQDVWQALAKIPLGQVRTYGQIAALVGRQGAARAVGGACGTNPAPLFVPCHRVVAAGGRLGGFGGGLPLKRKLLTLEGVKIANGRLQS